MAKYLRYAGEFLSRKGLAWRVEILQEANQAFAEVGELIFEANEALVIEWGDVSKEEVICPSSATLRIESPGDRTYEDLYTIEVGMIRMDVYKGKQLYWSGTLDPEFYEEPYERADKYPVSLTFSDFGILDRLKFNLAGLLTLREVLDDALTRSGINFTGVDASSYCSTYLDDQVTKADLTALSINGENFYDEDGEPSSLKDVVKGILQPLAQKIVQREGKIYVYDLNGLYNLCQAKQIVWDGDSQTMGVDKVINNVIINFSSYCKPQVMKDLIKYIEKVDADKVNLTSDNPNDPVFGEYYSYYPDYAPRKSGGQWDYNLVDMTIFLSKKGNGLASISERAKYFHVEPILGGAQKIDGVAWSMYTGGHGALADFSPKQKLNPVGKGSDTPLIRTKKIFLPRINEEGAYYLRLSLPMLLDPRYNPYTQTGNGANEDGNYDRFKENSAWVFAPVSVNLYTPQGEILLHYENKPIAESAAMGHLGYAKGAWKPGAASFGDAWLEYYNTDDQKNDTGILGWQRNRQCIGRPDHENRVNAQNPYMGGNQKFTMYESFKKMGDGEYIPYPLVGGYLEVVIHDGVRCFDFGEKYGFDRTDKWDKEGLYQKVRWLMYQSPQIDVVRNNLTFADAELTDDEISAWVNKNAKEELSIDTICGTAPVTRPTSRGNFFRTSSGMHISKLHRAGVTDSAEKLLCGTILSQFANRKTTLQGEALIEGGLFVYKEANQAGKKFVMRTETQNIIEDSTDATFVEFKPDEAELIDYVDGNE